ncbi:P-loop containing nucleoside triphosphate hydrolase protein [Lactarius quietus]|nr:P-loop containing nucleoside triphosphate hydrolase protein [Lactarius quietus]
MAGGGRIDSASAKGLGSSGIYGSGKMLTFWILLLFNGDGITIVVTPLVILGDKNVAELLEVSIPVLNLTMESVTDDTFKEIESLKYRIIITSPERVLTDHRFFELWKSKKFVNKLHSFIFDEAHCIVQWSGEFCPEYTDLGRLRWLLPSVLFYAVSATLPSHTLKRMQTALHMRQDNTREIRLSNDWPNINLLTLRMQDPVNSCYDILHVLSFDGNPPPPLFMVSCNDRKETERLCQFAHLQAPPDLARNLLWFHSGMSTRFWMDTIRKLRSHEIWGIFCTDAAGMAFQWKYTDSLCTLWQHLGRAERDPSNEATGIYIVKPSYMDDQRVQAEKRAAIRAEKAQQRQQGLDAGTATDAATSQVKTVPRKRPCCPHDQCVTDTPRPAGTLIMFEDCHKDVEEAAMDAYINAHLRGICRCGVSDEFFDNRLASPSMACPYTNCPCCAVKVPRFCCDTCNPDSFVLLSPSTTALKQTWALNKFKVMDYILSETDKKLKTALQNWRGTQLSGTVGDNDMFRPQLIMTDDVLDRLVGLAHYSKVSDLTSIRTQVSWRHVDLWGADVLDIIKTYYPLDEPTSPRPALQAVDKLPGPSVVQPPSNAPTATVSSSRDIKCMRE